MTLMKKHELKFERLKQDIINYYNQDNFDNQTFLNKCLNIFKFKSEKIFHTSNMCITIVKNVLYISTSYKSVLGEEKINLDKFLTINLSKELNNENIFTGNTKEASLLNFLNSFSLGSAISFKNRFFRVGVPFNLLYYDFPLPYGKMVKLWHVRIILCHN